MKKLLAIIVLGLLWSGNAYSDEKILTIQCQYDDPNLAIFKPIYTINLKTKSVKSFRSRGFVVGKTTTSRL